MTVRTTTVLAVATIAIVLCASIVTAMYREDPKDEPVIAEGLPKFTISGETDLPGNIFVSFVFTKNLIMFDGKGNIVWSLHEDLDPGVAGGTWDFKKHVIGGKTYYSYHDQDVTQDKYGIEGFAPGDRVIMDASFKEVKRIRFEASDTVEKGRALDGHDFLLIDLNHYIMSGYIKQVVYNVPGYPDGSSVVYSYLQEVKDGEVVWDWKSIDYPELYSLTVTDAVATANDFANQYTDAPDYVHFNAMRLNDDGDLVCSFRHLNTIMCLDRTKSMDQIKWKLSGNADMYSLSDDQRTSSQHYVTVTGDEIMAFDNHNSTERTRIVTYDVDMHTQTLNSFKEYRIDGKFSSACGSAQRVSGDLFMIGWGCTENDAVCFSVYDFASDKELMSMTLDAPQNFTYRCVYYE